MVSSRPPHGFACPDEQVEPTPAPSSCDIPRVSGLAAARNPHYPFGFTERPHGSCQRATKEDNGPSPSKPAQPQKLPIPEENGRCGIAPY